ncbi:methyltransferase-like protein 24 [Penaeus japonicus]|uniref:methyltransferase-like protein 24 n=1 Tax=Penaeus japonicus TaxID=27405 RepID=UPI001C711C5B|nr:methyltransferase-like protein 24 [Penaeus japonicus]
MILKASDFTMSSKLRLMLSAWACLVLFVVLGGHTALLQPASVAYRNLQHTPGISRNTESNSSSRGRLKNELEYFELLGRTSGYCRKLVTFGGSSCRRLMDGDKQVCLDDHLSMPRKDCLVYSFGAGYDVSFEDELIDFAGCELHLYDPTTNATGFIESEDKINFHKIGLSDSDKIIMANDTRKSFQLLPFDKVLSQNGHLGRTIHYLKIDIESSEWEALPYMLEKGLLDNVLQLSMELHSNFLIYPSEKWMEVLQRQHDILLSIEAIGFRKISYRENMNMAGFIKLPYEEDQRPCCGEVLYVRDPSSLGHVSVI